MNSVFTSVLAILLIELWSYTTPYPWWVDLLHVGGVAVLVRMWPWRPKENV
jgi:hypothetical protein